MTTQASHERRAGLADLTVDLVDDDHGVVMVVAGELDMTSIDTLRGPLLAAVEQGGPLQVDLADLTFVDSSGLRILVEAWAAVREGGSFTVVHPSERVRRVLEVTGLADTFGLVDE